MFRYLLAGTAMSVIYYQMLTQFLRVVYSRTMANDVVSPSGAEGDRGSSRLGSVAVNAVGRFVDPFAIDIIWKYEFKKYVLDASCSDTT